MGRTQNLKKSPTCFDKKAVYLVASKQVGDFFNFVWPFQKSWTFPSIIWKFWKWWKEFWHVAISRVFQIQQIYIAEENNRPLCTVFGMISNTKGWKKNRINDESMENWSALHINGRKVHYREQSLVVATAKIIIMSALGPNPCLAPSSASISRIPYTFGVTSLFVCLFACLLVCLFACLNEMNEI